VGRDPVLHPGSGFDAMGVYVAPGLIVADQSNAYWMYYLGVALGHDAIDAVAARKGGIGRFKVVLTSP
jgi:hypothetical protein